MIISEDDQSNMTSNVLGENSKWTQINKLKKIGCHFITLWHVGFYND